MGNGVTIDIAGNIIITGFFSGTMTYQNVTVTSAGIWDVFIAKFNPDGSLIWLKSAGGNQSDIGHRVVADHLGNIAVVGEFQKTATFGTNSVTSAGSTDAFIAKYNGNGTNLWVKRGGSNQGFNGDIANGVAVDGSNNFYVTGEFASNATFDNLSISSTGPNAVDVFVAKYNKSGVIQWVHNGGGPDVDRGLGIDADASGNTFVSGFADSGPGVAFDSISLPPIGNEYIFLAKYNPAGSILYVKQYAPGIGEDIDVTGGGCLFMGGGVSISPQPEFDSIDLTFTDRNAFMGKFCESVSLPCNPPTGLLVQTVTANSAKIHWNADNSAVSYLVEYRKSGVSIWKKKVVVSNFIKLKNLTPSTDYEYRVATICSGDTSEFSAIKTFTTAPFRLDENGSVSVEVNAYPNPNAGHFTLEIDGFAGDVSVDIFDVNGKVIYHEASVASEEGLKKSISLPDSFRGLALIRISDGSQMISKTISVE